MRLELQADCYAGVWAKHATTVPGADGQVLITEITDADLANAVQTAGAIGDDYIQTNLAGQQVDPSQFSHGTLGPAAEVAAGRLPQRRSRRVQHLRHQRSGLIQPWIQPAAPAPI